jgi:hypothetical protein
VGFADLAGQDVAAILDRQQRTGALRGIRQQLHWHANAAYRYAARPDLMADPQWRLGLAEVTRRGRCPLYVRNHCYASTRSDAP